MSRQLITMMLLLGMTLMISAGWGIITDYTFSSTIESYAEITGGTIHGSPANVAEVFNNIPIGFEFNYNGTNYTAVSIATKGFIAMGTEVATSNNAISAGTTNNVAVALNRDIRSRADGELSSLLAGTAPNRVFTIQWKNYRRNTTSTVNDTLSFQIRLHETSNLITFNYGHCYTVNFSLAATVQVGLRGASNAEFVNRATTSNWTATTAGTTNSATCTLNNLIVPPEGLVFSWSPPVAGTPPNPAVIISPADGTSNISIAANLVWLTGGGSPTGYKVYLGTDNPPTNLVNGASQTAATYNPDNDFNYSTLYYWKIVPFNDFGDAAGCPVWSFTSMTDPTVTDFPYTHAWDDVTAPLVSPSWTVVNANGDGFTWTAVSTGYQSAPNALRCAYNSSSSIAMDDWIISPPLQLTGGTFYQISFMYKAQNVSYPEKLEIKYGTGNTVAALTEQIYLNENINNTGYLNGLAFMSPVTNGIYHFGFHGISNPNMYYIYIDDVTVSEVIPVFNPPQSLTAVTGNGSVELNWQAPDSRGLRGYHVFRNDIQITPEFTTATTYTDNAAPVGTPCTYYVKALYVAPNGISDPSNTVSITPAFNSPDSLTAQCSATYVMLAWQPPAGFIPAGYVVYRDGETLTPTPITVTSYQDITIAAGITYEYHVTAVYANPEGESAPSNSVMGEAISPPTELTASVTDPNVTLYWISPFVPGRTADSKGTGRELLGFKVFRDGSLIQTINSPDTETYTDLNLLPATYVYTVTALYTSGESSPAGPVQATVTSAFIPPANLTATGSLTNIYLTWNRPNPLLPNLGGYRLFRDGIPMGHGLLADTTYTDTAIIYGVTYSYYVVAVYTNPNGTSAPSNTVTASGGEELDPVTNLQYTVALDNISLTWTPPGGPIYQDWIHYDDGFNDNAIGADGPANFDVAARFTQTELSGITDRYVTKVRFFPAEANCVYSVKIWTGGTAVANPGTLALTLPVANPSINAWNEVDLPAPIQVPSSGELRIGINCNAQAGYPAGCDNGPSIPGKSNLIYADNEWSILSEINPDLDFNWNIQAFVVNYIGRETILTHQTEPMSETVYAHIDPAQFKAIANPRTDRIGAARDETRPLSGYKVYRDGMVIANITDITVSNYTDSGLPNGSYTYTVTAVYTTGESAPCDPVTATVNVPIVPIIFADSFENYPNFALSFGQWMLNDVDNSSTILIDDFDFPNEGSPMAFMIFNPGATTPPVTELAGHTGMKMAASLAAVNGPNHDWMISPRMRMGTENMISLWIRTAAQNDPPERFRVGISTADNPTPASFTMLSGPNYVEAPANWTYFSYPVPPAFNVQFVRFGIKCETPGGSALLVDDVKIQGYNGVGTDEEVQIETDTALLGSRPNPFRTAASISYNLKSDMPARLEIYNLKGQKVRTLADGLAKAGSHKVSWQGDDDQGRPVSAGIYFCRLTAEKSAYTHKIVLIR